MLWYWSRTLTATSVGPWARPTVVPVQVVPDATTSMVANVFIFVSGERLTIPEGVSSDRVRAGDTPCGMLTLPSAVRIYVATGATDLRR